MAKPKSFPARLPNHVRMRAEADGERGRSWIAGLDDCVDRIERKWRLQVGEVLHGGSESLVGEAHFEDGRSAILKIGLPGSADLAKEACVYALAAGRGYAELYAHDEDENAILLERLGAPLRTEARSVDAQTKEICRTLSEAWIPLEGSSGLMTGAEKARWLAAFIREKWQSSARPCQQETIDRALAFTEERADAFAADGSVLVHGDAHSENTLLVRQSDGERERHYKFVDPDGLFAEKACDLAVPMRDWSEELLQGNTVRLARQRCELLAELTGVDGRGIWQWGFMERVSTGLVMLVIGMATEGAEVLEVADRIRAEPSPS